MASLRERKKQEIREQILQAARVMFLNQGYEKTTVAQIAAEAGIAVGTFYNYFASKSELFLVTFFASPEEYASRAAGIIRAPKGDLPAAVEQLVDVYLNGVQNVSKDAWKEIIAVFASDIDEHKRTMRDLIALDFQFMEQLRNLLEFYRTEGRLVETFAPGDGAEIIYGIFAVQMLMYLLQEERTLDEMRDGIFRQVRAFFADKYSHRDAGA